MPKFNENEKAIIRNKLLSEGESLFTQHGIRKVTVDDLAAAAKIAKGSFYSFYKNKEHLYMEILSNTQKKIGENTEKFLQENCLLSPRNLTKQLIIWFLTESKNYPILTQQNAETTEYLFRKLPPEVLEAHTHDDKQELMKLMEHGIKFKCDLETVAKTFQALAITFFNLQSSGNGNNDAVIEILINGVINEIVGDEND